MKYLFHNHVINKGARNNHEIQAEEVSLIKICRGHKADSWIAS